MRKGRSGESPHGKNCGMKSRLAGAVRCLVHACLTAAANVGALCMKGWRWMLGAFARTRTSAKRTLTNIEGVLVTLALIATLGIASPLAAGAVEPVEDPTPVSGVLDADGAQIADAADSDDVTDESDVADSDETAKDDASADQDATEGDAADEATEDADADADASEKDVSTDGEQSEDAVDGDVYEDDEGKSADEADGGQNGVSKVQSRAKTAMETDNTFQTDGGELSLAYLFANYNVITFGDAGVGHVVGPMLVGGDFTKNTNLGGDLVHTAHTYIKGSIYANGSRNLTHIYNHNNNINLYLGVNNGVIADEKNDDLQKLLQGDTHGTVYLTDSYLDFSEMKKAAIAKSNSLAQGAIDLKLGVTNNGQWDFSNAGGNAWKEGDGTLVLKAGKSYKISADFLKSVYIQHVVLDATDIADYHGGSADDMPETTLTITDTYPENETMPLPAINIIRYKNADGKEITEDIDDKKYAGTNTNQYANGIPLVFNIPTATKVSYGGGMGKWFGHVIAPNAEASASGDYNGCWMADSFIGNGEGHMWPYTGTRLAVNTPDQFVIEAKKTMIGRGLQNEEFSFALWNADDNWKQTDRQPIQTKQNQANGSIAFDAIVVTKDDVHIWGSWLQHAWGIITSSNKTYTETKTLRYLIREVKPNPADGAITYDETVYRVAVEATLTADFSHNPLKPDTTIFVTTPVYTRVNADGTTESLGDAKPEFVNTVKTTKLTVTKKMAEEGDTADGKSFDFNIYLSLPEGTALKPAGSADATEPVKLFFDNRTDSTRDTFAYACEPNAAKTGCQVSNGTASKQEFYIPAGTQIALPNDEPGKYADKFDVRVEKVRENGKETNRSTIKLERKSGHENEPVPQEIAWPQLVVGAPGASGTVSCPGNPEKQCTQVTTSIQAGENHKWTSPDLPVGTYYYVEEPVSAIPGGFALEGYECSTNARAASTQPCSGTLQVNDNGNPVQVSIVVTNKRTTVPLSIMKIVDNWQDVPQGNDQDTTFGFSVSLYDKNSNALNNVTYPYKVYEGNKEVTDAGGTLTCSTTNRSTVGTCGTLELKHNQTAVIEGLPYGTRFVVKEQTPKDPFKWDSQEVTGISSTSGCKDSDENGKCAVTSAGVLVKVHNRYELRVVLPETGGKAHPFMTMLFGVGVVCAGLLITAIYMRRQGMAMLQ